MLPGGRFTSRVMASPGFETTPGLEVPEMRFPPIRRSKSELGDVVPTGPVYKNACPASNRVPGGRETVKSTCLNWANQSGGFRFQ